MKYLDLTLPTAAENLACDEALLDWCEEGDSNEGPQTELNRTSAPTTLETGCESTPELGASLDGILRVWEARQHFVVLGYANKVAQEVDVEACRAKGVPILRRCSGGGTVLQGPGCLNYSLLLKIEDTGLGISQTNCFIMKRNADILASLLGRSVNVQGVTDLALNNLKFSGNAQRRKRHWLLFHGTFLLDFDLGLVEKLLLLPSKQPAYRQNRSHLEFLTRLDVKPQALKTALQRGWQATVALGETPRIHIARLVAEKYAQDSWNLKW